MKELAKTVSSEYVVPIRWVIAGGTVHADVHDAFYHEQSKTFSVHTGSTHRIMALSLQFNALDLQVQYKNISFSGECFCDLHRRFQSDFLIFLVHSRPESTMGDCARSTNVSSPCYSME